MKLCSTNGSYVRSAFGISLQQARSATHACTLYNYAYMASYEVNNVNHVEPPMYVFVILLTAHTALVRNEEVSIMSKRECRINSFEAMAPFHAVNCTVNCIYVSNSKAALI